jgi:stearoyl-CoA desaturase (delta-9 desaturase)
MSPSHKLLVIHILCHMAIIPALLYGDVWMWIVSFVWWQWISATAISSGYHRYFSHRSFKTGEWYKWYVQFVGIFANPGPVLTWAATHRMHHAYSDSEKDPHSPKFKGFLKIYTSRWGDNVKIKRRFLTGLISDRSVKFFHTHYFTLSILLAGSLFLVDPLLLIFGYCIPVVLAFHGYGLLNAYTHKDGKPKNSFFANILTAGEGWHKNHHDRGGDWRIGRKWWQWDTGAIFIRIIKKGEL